MPPLLSKYKIDLEKYENERKEVNPLITSINKTLIN